MEKYFVEGLTHKNLKRIQSRSFLTQEQAKNELKRRFQNGTIVQGEVIVDKPPYTPIYELNTKGELRPKIEVWWDNLSPEKRKEYAELKKDSLLVNEDNVRNLPSDNRKEAWANYWTKLKPVKVSASNRARSHRRRKPRRR